MLNFILAHQVIPIDLNLDYIEGYIRMVKIEFHRRKRPIQHEARLFFIRKHYLSLPNNQSYTYNPEVPNALYQSAKIKLLGQWAT